MLKALIIDDEPRASGILELMIERFVPEISRTWCCNDARQAAAMIHELKPDLVFLDIRMPFMDGFEVLSQIREKRFKIIFTTAYHEYTLQAIRFSAFDYLLKPVDVQELIHAVQRYLDSRDELSFQPEQLRNILANLQTNAVAQFRLAVPTKEGIHFFHPAEIVRLEAMGAYTQLYLADKRQHLVSKSLGEYEELLGEHGFVRTHKSHLVNRQFVAFLDREGFVVMRDNTRVEVARRRKEEVWQMLRS
ncbi:MAG: DNA-binding response regulator [Haliscomenobacteraceae bacterium CHB4]|nr:Chemotaxis response regulator protein-glutamate methylesterase [Saprospiraceae bacterium]MCE7926026.1 DNA-binding response regulator [Haliscomenobacteraceae bacterium CHB4]